jgi:hypothetical protein
MLGAKAPGQVDSWSTVTHRLSTGITAEGASGNDQSLYPDNALVLIARHHVYLGHIACESDGVGTTLIQFSDDKILACTRDLLIPHSACWLLRRHGFYSLKYQTTLRP